MTAGGQRGHETAGLARIRGRGVPPTPGSPAHPDSQQRPIAEADQLNPDSGVALPTPAGNPQLVSASATHQRRPRRWLRLALALTLALGLSGAGFFLGSSWTARTLPRLQVPPAPVTQPTSVTATSIVVRQVATPACLEAAKRGDALITLLVNNKRSRAARLLVPYHVASRQCARDAGP
jgi:hypothetical protein